MSYARYLLFIGGRSLDRLPGRCEPATGRQVRPPPGVVKQRTQVPTAEFGHDCHEHGVQVETMQQQNSISG